MGRNDLVEMAERKDLSGRLGLGVIGGDDRADGISRLPDELCTSGDRRYGMIPTYGMHLPGLSSHY
jgi:hypothetical protein